MDMFKEYGMTKQEFLDTFKYLDETDTERNEHAVGIVLAMLEAGQTLDDFVK